jgi:hypothetical protein
LSSAPGGDSGDDLYDVLDGPGHIARARENLIQDLATEFDPGRVRTLREDGDRRSALRRRMEGKDCVEAGEPYTVMGLVQNDSVHVSKQAQARSQPGQDRGVCVCVVRHGAMIPDRYIDAVRHAAAAFSITPGRP